jgi:multiple sugar transport system substrate-binding protein
MKNIILCSAIALLECIALIVCAASYGKLPFAFGKTITVGVFSDSYWEVQNGYSYYILEDAIDRFEDEHPGITVEYTSGILKDDYSEWLSEQMLSGDAPDVFFILGDDFNDFAEVGALMDLGGMIAADDSFDVQDYYSSAYAYGRYDDAQYALPYECAPKLMFANKSILDAEGLQIPDDEWTWDDFYEICSRVTRDTDGNGTIDQFGVVGYTWKDAFESNGIQLFEDEGTKCNLTGEQAEAALDFIEKLDELNGGTNVETKDFDLGKVVFEPMSFSSYRAYKPYPLSIKKYSGFEWECIPMPAGPDGANISTLDTLLVGISSRTSHENEAWDFIKALTYDTEIQSEIFDYSEGVSVLKSVTESDEVLAQLLKSSGESGMNLSILSEAVEHAVVSPRFREYDEAVEYVDKAVTEILSSTSNMRMEQIIWNRTIDKYLQDSVN